ncbi:uncharacterized protein [Temnothorax nylanderi]|uniref:uncharacterized protein n=1 Tax=Temnothorax nylanderi TaxID=102681 RepID=UPI003A8AE5B0
MQKILSLLEMQNKRFDTLEVRAPVSGQISEKQGQTVPEDRGIDPALEIPVVTFEDEVEPDNIPPPAPPSLADELFAVPTQPPVNSSWEPALFEFTRKAVREGIDEALRTQLLQKYEAKAELAALSPPKLNKILVPALKPTASAIKRNEYQMQEQRQVAACLRALGSGISELLKPDITSLLPERSRDALLQVADGIRLLADHQHNLSLARRAFIKPALSMMGKTIADSATIDEWLFGSSFTEELKDAQACEKAARDLKKAAPPAPKAVLQPARQASDQWEAITSDPVVLDAIRNYRIPFSSSPPSRPFITEPKFSRLTASRCDKEIARLLYKGAITVVEPSADQFLSSFFLVEKSSGGVRFVLNLRDLNTFLSPPHFKLEDWRTVVQLLLPGTYMATLDLEDAYLLVPIHPDDRKFLCFQWRGVVYAFAALPFGLSTAPYIFTKILRPVTTYLRRRGFSSVLYLDDFLMFGSSPENCLDNVHKHIELLSSLGFIVNFKKSDLEPSTLKKYLGFNFDSIQQAMSIPDVRREKLLRLIYTKRLEAAKFNALISAGGSYDATMDIPLNLQEDFCWWRKALSDRDHANKFCFGQYAYEIFTDASLTGWGACCGLERAHGWWSSEDGTRHINKLELLAAYYGLRCFASNLHDCEILLRLDNTTALSYVNRYGSIKHHRLSAISREIWQWCEQRNIFLFASYIASIDNKIADEESRCLKVDSEWSLSEEAFDDQASGLQDTIPGGRQIIREAFRLQQVSETAIETLMASLAPATVKQYARPLRSWWQFCHQHNFSPFAPLPNQVLDFLAKELASVGSYSTLNTARSAVSLISKNGVGNNPLIKRFCKEASVIKPPRPRYNCVWDPSPVIAELGKQFPHEDLSLEAVTKKLVTGKSHALNIYIIIVHPDEVPRHNCKIKRTYQVKFDLNYVGASSG